LEQILKVENAVKRYGTVVALSDVSFELCAGEIHCLVGENGAGKSTLIKMLSGAISPDEGVLTVFGNEYKRLTPALARKLGIETIYQENIICPDLPVMENIYLGIESRKGLLVDRKKMRDAAKELVERIGVDIDVETPISKISPAQQKIVQVLKALAKNAKILILDEPTASFSKNEIDKVLDIVVKVKNTGTGILFISHHLEEVFKIADRVTVLKDGEKVALHDSADYTENQLISEMIGRDPSSFFRKKKHGKTSDVTLEIKNYSRDSIVKDVSFSVHKGEVLGIAGMVGSGRSELARIIVGADKKSSGELLLNGRKHSINGPRAAMKIGIGLLPEDRKKDGNISGQSIQDNIMMAEFNYKTNFIRNFSKENLIAKKYIDLLKIRTPDAKNSINNLSGGNQQKVILARWLAVNSLVLIFDEPTRGVDVGAKEEIYKLIDDMVENGKSVIMISSELPELIAMSDRVLVMREGSVVAEVTGDDINEEKLMMYSIGRNI